MRLLAECPISHGSTSKQIMLFQGDLASIPIAETVDCLVVSAFPNDYTPTHASLIGALARKGISVAELARDKEVDLRESFSCWISKDLRLRFPHAGFRRLLCFEPLIRGNPAELTVDVFSALMPFALGEPPIRSLAMPVLASGDQGFDDVAMFDSLFRATVWWLGNGMPVEIVKIVVYSDASAQRLQSSFQSLRSTIIPEKRERPIITDRFDCFISYSRDDSLAVDQLQASLEESSAGIRVFRDCDDILPGTSWQVRIDDALEHCRKVLAVYSPSYLRSPMCKEEFDLARIRHRDSSESIIIPIYLRSADLPLYMRSIQYVDCREANLDLIRQSCRTELRAALA